MWWMRFSVVDVAHHAVAAVGLPCPHLASIHTAALEAPQLAPWCGCPSQAEEGGGRGGRAAAPRPYKDACTRCMMQDCRSKTTSKGGREPQAHAPGP